jgi:outer membrane protein assembly factor BamE
MMPSLSPKPKQWLQTGPLMNRFPSLNRLPALVLIAGLSLLTVGCVYRIDIQQGNFLEPKDIDQVTVGMTRSQVRYLLGTPIVGNAFQNSRWDYVYYLKRGRSRDTFQAHFTVHFEDDKVTRIVRNNVETGPNATASATPAD